jgi:hypothetical protein
MPTSGTTSFNPDFADIAEEAFEMAGLEMRTGYDLRSARRSLDLLAIEWANRGLNLWTIEQGTVPLVAGTATYTLPTDTIDIIEHVVRSGTGTSQVDIDLYRISVSGYSAIVNKNTPGKPSQIYIDRARSQPSVTLWPVPNVSSTYTLVYQRLRRIQDSGAATNTADLPFRFIPAMVAGLAYYVAMKRPEAMERVPFLKKFYEEQFDLASQEDRSRASWYHHPVVYPVT